MKQAPDFTLPDQDGREHSLSDYLSHWIVLYFYPKDDTPGCTTEACSFRDSVKELERHKVTVLGVSADSVASHKKFADKYHLPFCLLSDKDKHAIKAYHAWGKKKFMGREFEGILRTTYLINPQGEVAKVYENVNPTQHAGQILHDLVSLQGK